MSYGSFEILFEGNSSSTLIGNYVVPTSNTASNLLRSITSPHGTRIYGLGGDSTAFVHLSSRIIHPNSQLSCTASESPKMNLRQPPNRYRKGYGMPAIPEPWVRSHPGEKEELLSRPFYPRPLMKGFKRYELL